MNPKISIFLKGIFMGISDLIPGISGGTIAFITGIYERLISAITNISFKNYYQLLQLIITNKVKQRKKLIKKLDIYFLLILFSGIFLSIIIGSHLISYLIKNYYIYVFAFFIGLILASSKIIYTEIEIHNKFNLLFLTIGFIFGLSLIFLIPTTIINPSFIYILFAGFLAILALFLPGISGSFILVILGLYEYIINSVKNIIESYKNIIPFAIGAILGVFIISRVITYLFEKDKSKTLYTLLGIVLGTLIIPIKNIYENLEIISTLIIFKLAIFLILGFFIVKLIEKK